MNQYPHLHGGAAGARPAAEAADNRRERFIVRTYNHLFLAILAFAGIEVALFMSGLAEPIAQTFLSQSWLLILGGFVLVSWLASHVALRSDSLPKQYAALGGFVLAEALIFVPLLYIANQAAPGVISSAALVTLVGFAGLTGIAFWTKKDFSFLGGILRWAMICALLVIVGGVVFGFQLGMFFSVAMVGVAGAAILYDTSNVLHHFPEDRYVAGALHLFSSVALMLWYVIQIFLMSRD